MKQKVNPLQILVVASFALLLAACGSDSKGQPPAGGAGGDGGTWGTGGDGGSGATDGTGGTGGSGGTGGTGGGVEEGACLEMCDHVYQTCKSSLDRTYGRCQFDCKNGLISEELMNCASGACAAIPSCLPGGDGGSGGDPGTGGTGGDPGTGGAGGDTGTGGTGGGGPKPSAACYAACQPIVQCGGMDANFDLEACAEECRDDEWSSRLTACFAGTDCANRTPSEIAGDINACLGWANSAQCDAACQNVYKCDPEFFVGNTVSQCTQNCANTPGFLTRDQVYCYMSAPSTELCDDDEDVLDYLLMCHYDPLRAECFTVCSNQLLTPANGNCGYSIPGGNGYGACLVACEDAGNQGAKPWSDKYLICLRNAFRNSCTGMSACESLR